MLIRGAENVSANKLWQQFIGYLLVGINTLKRFLLYSNDMAHFPFLKSARPATGFSRVSLKKSPSCWSWVTEIFIWSHIATTEPKQSRYILPVFRFRGNDKWLAKLMILLLDMHYHCPSSTSHHGCIVMYTSENLHCLDLKCHCWLWCWYRLT